MIPLCSRARGKRTPAADILHFEGYVRHGLSLKQTQQTFHHPQFERNSIVWPRPPKRHALDTMTHMRANTSFKTRTKCKQLSSQRCEAFVVLLVQRLRVKNCSTEVVVDAGCLVQHLPVYPPQGVREFTALNSNALPLLEQTSIYTYIYIYTHKYSASTLPVSAASEISLRPKSVKHCWQWTSIHGRITDFTLT